MIDEVYYDKLVDEFIEDTLRNRPNQWNNLREEVIVRSFPQTWSDTTGPFGGIGGRAMTNMRMTVVYAFSEPKAHVYCGNKLIYRARLTPEFLKDVNVERMASIAEARTKYPEFEEAEK